MLQILLKRIALLFLWILFLPQETFARPIIADLSERVISIDTRFTGENLLLYGARNQPGEILIVVKGPKHSYRVWKKKRIFGFWANDDHVDFTHIDSFYHVASSQPFSLYQNNALLESVGIKVHDPFGFIPKSIDGLETPPFKEAMLNQLESRSLYSRTPQEVSFLEKMLFRLQIPFPKLVPEGIYLVSIFLISNGDIASEQIIPVRIERAGFDAMIYDLAHERPLSYGTLSILVALLSGWIIRVLFQKFIGSNRR